MVHELSLEVLHVTARQGVMNVQNDFCMFERLLLCILKVPQITIDNKVLVGKPEV